MGQILFEICTVMTFPLKMIVEFLIKFNKVFQAVLHFNNAKFYKYFNIFNLYLCEQSDLPNEQRKSFYVSKLI